MLKFFPRSASATIDGEHTRRPEEAVQSGLGLDRLSHLSTVDWCGAQWLGEARWFYTKGMHYAFWSAAGVWSVVFLQPSVVATAAISAAASFCIWQTIECGLQLQDAFERESHAAEAATRLWQHEDIARRRAELKLHQSTPQWGSGEGTEEDQDYPSSVVFLQPVNGREPQF